MLIRLFGFQLYNIQSHQQVVMALNKLPKRGTINQEGQPRGWIIGYPYIGYIFEESKWQRGGSSERPHLYIVTTQSFYDSITKHEDEIHKENVIEKEKIKMYDRIGSYDYLSYTKRELDVTDKKARDNQSNAIEKITTLFKQKKQCVVILHGMTGIGKSMIPILITKQLKGAYCDSFNPIDPGDDITLLYNACCPTSDNPLIVVLEEFDIIMDKIHAQTVKHHKKVPIQIYDKITWNRFMDRIDLGMFPHMILVMISNKDPSCIDTMDPSYIRTNEDGNGRVNLRINII